MGEGAGVDDVLGAEPALAGEGDAEIEEAEMLGLMGIGIDAAEDAEIPSLVPPAPIEVEPPRVAVELDPGAGLSGDLEYLRHIHRIGLALEEEPTGGMAETGDAGIFHGADEAIGVVLFIRTEAGVDGGDDVIQLREHGVGKIRSEEHTSELQSQR